MKNNSLYTKDYHRRILENFHRNTLYQKDKNRNVLKLVSPCKEDVILDVGCSSGGSTFLLHQRGAEVFGIDMDKEAIEVALEYKENNATAYDKCHFSTGRAEDAIVEMTPNKLTMIDFTEHVCDDKLIAILRGLHIAPEPFLLFIYTPCRTHWIERFKAHKFLIKQDETHIALRDMDETVSLLKRSGFRVLRRYYRPSHLPIFKYLERMMATVPLIGPLFRRRLLLCLEPAGREE